MSTHDPLKKEQPNSGQRDEPAPEPPPGDNPRLHIHDGLDNSDLRMLLDLATAQAKGKE